MDDGRVEVGVQQREGDGWGERLLPDARFLAADAEADVWRNSSPVAIDAASATPFIELYAPRERFDRLLALRPALNYLADGEPAICLVVDTLGDGHREVCERIAELHDGELTILETDDPDELRTMLSAALPTIASDRSLVATNLVTALVATGTPRADGQAQQMFYVPTEWRPFQPTSDDTFCIVTHGGDQDIFWGRAQSGGDIATQELRLNNKWVTGVVDPVDGVKQCLERGAKTIAMTLAQTETAEEAISLARAEGARVLTFNSGAEVAGAAGSSMHIAIDEHRAGEMAGEQFAAIGVEGTVLCVIHEADNVGLERRCDGLESGYPGEVERVRVDHLMPDYQAVGGMLAQRFAGPNPPAGVIALQGIVGSVALGASEAVGADVAVATFGINLETFQSLLQGRLAFIMEDQPLIQGYLAVAGMALINALEADPHAMFGGVNILMTPRVIDQAVAQQIFDGLLHPSR